MAKASKTTTAHAETVTLELTANEAVTLHSLVATAVSGIGTGFVEFGRRSQIDAIGAALAGARVSCVAGLFDTSAHLASLRPRPIADEAGETL